MKNNLADRRTDIPMTQDELAEKAGVTKATISLIENDKQTPTLITKKKIAKALGLTVEDIFPESN
jgi:putative transcriptional regulator